MQRRQQQRDPRARCPRRPPRGTSGRCGPRGQQSGSRSSVQNAQRSGPSRAPSAAGRAGCARSTPRASPHPRRASRAPPRRSSPRDRSGCPRPRRRRAAPPVARRRGRGWLAPSSRDRASFGSPAMTPGKLIISATPSRRVAPGCLHVAKSSGPWAPKLGSPARTTAPSRARRAAGPRRRLEHPFDAVGAEHIRRAGAGRRRSWWCRAARARGPAGRRQLGRLHMECASDRARRERLSRARPTRSPPA